MNQTLILFVPLLVAMAKASIGVEAPNSADAPLWLKKRRLITSPKKMEKTGQSVTKPD